MNVPVVLIANSLPASLKKRGPFHERFMRLRFKHKIADLKAERLAATLYGCIQRRFLQLFGDDDVPSPKEAVIHYNEEILNVCEFPCSSVEGEPPFYVKSEKFGTLGIVWVK